MHVAQERKKLERRGFTPSPIDAEISRYATAINRLRLRASGGAGWPECCDE
ncbi:hypothetical protein [Mesorhizobium sp. M0587]|uniref:hypothetical protein n=1 Tax=Mesorhizobium sp. M0587 TaxID=2956964 RepID=UPI00333CCFD7